MTPLGTAAPPRTRCPSVASGSFERPLCCFSKETLSLLCEIAYSEFSLPLWWGPRHSRIWTKSTPLITNAKAAQVPSSPWRARFDWWLEWSSVATFSSCRKIANAEVGPIHHQEALRKSSGCVSLFHSLHPLFNQTCSGPIFELAISFQVLFNGFTCLCENQKLLLSYAKVSYIWPHCRFWKINYAALATPAKEVSGRGVIAKLTGPCDCVGEGFHYLSCLRGESRRSPLWLAAGLIWRLWHWQGSYRRPRS